MQTEVFAVTAHPVQTLQDEAEAAAENLAEIQGRVDALQNGLDTSARRLRSAATLTASLSDEAHRWTAAAASQEAALAAVPAAALLDAAALTFLGPRRAPERAALLRRWREGIREAGLEVPEEWSMQASLGCNTEQRTWYLQVWFYARSFIHLRCSFLCCICSSLYLMILGTLCYMRCHDSQRFIASHREAT